MAVRPKDIEAPQEPLTDLSAERRVLGILVRHPEQADAVVDRLSPEHFSHETHRTIYRAILDSYTKTGRVSYTQLYRSLSREGHIPDLETVLMGLTQAFISVAELAPSVEILVEKRAKRKLMEATEQIQRMLLIDEELSLEECQSMAQELIFAATQAGADESDAKDLLEVLNKCFSNLLERQQGISTYGLSVRFPSIDAFTTGFKKKDLIILAARPSMGKTALALNFATNVAKRDIPVLIFSLEMDDEQIGDRIVLSELMRFRPSGQEITSFDYSTKLDPDQFEKVQSIYNELYSLPIKIVDRRGLTAAEIRAKARQVKAELPELGLIIIDYLQLIKPPPGSNKNWALVVGEIVREIRDLAGELDVPIIMLSQLNRGVESRDNKRPMMSDLRDSGNIEEFADVIMFLYRDDYYYPEQAAENGTQGQVEVIFAKQRRGPTGKVTLRFIKEYTRFVEEAPIPAGEAGPPVN